MKYLSLLVAATALIMSIGCSGCDPSKVNIDDSVHTNEEPSPITWEDCSHVVGDHPCDFNLTDQNGNNWNLYDHYGSIIVLDFSTEWCYYCQVAASEAQTLQDAYIDQGVIYVTILVEDSFGTAADYELVKLWADNFGITAPVLAGSRDLLSSTNPDGWIVDGWPTFYIIDREMILETSMRGYSATNLMLIIDNMLVEEVEEAE
jgi:thiol-disulfide isomerase/thioredoxin